MTRTQFITGFGRIRLVFHCIALLVWLSGIAIGIAVALDQPPKQSFPYAPFYNDIFLWTVMFIYLGERVLSAVTIAPVAIVEFLIAGFLNLDDEGIPAEHWTAFKRVCQARSTVRYLASVIAWAAAVTAASVLRQPRLLDRVTHLLVFRGDVTTDAAAWRMMWLSYVGTILLAAFIRFGLGLYLTCTFDRSLERYLLRSTGKKGFEALQAYVLRVGELAPGGRLLTAFVRRWLPLDVTTNKQPGSEA